MMHIKAAPRACESANLARILETLRLLGSPDRRLDSICECANYINIEGLVEKLQRRSFNHHVFLSSDSHYLLVFNCRRCPPGIR